VFRGCAAWPDPDRSESGGLNIRRLRKPACGFPSFASVLPRLVSLALFHCCSLPAPLRPIPRLVAEVFALIRRLAKEGMSFLLVEQSVRQALRIADRRLVLVQGEVRFAGSPSALSGEGRLMDLYFGRRPPGDPDVRESAS